MTEPVRRDPVARLLATVPVDLRWCADSLDAYGVPEHSELAARLRGIADRAEAAIAADDPLARWEALDETVPQQRSAAQILRVTEVREQRHRANNLLQSAENAAWVLTKVACPAAAGPARA